MDFFTIMIILITLVVFVFIVLISFVLKKSKDVKNEAFLEDERKLMLQNVLKRRKKLVPYKTDLQLQITDAMTFERSEDVRSIHTTGFLYNTQQKPIVAFERVERGKNATGQLVAITKKQTFAFTFLGLNISLFCDDVLLGTWDNSGNIYNSDKQQIGHAKRPTNSTERSHFPLVMNQREIAQLQTAPLYDTIENTSTVSTIFEELNFGALVLSKTTSSSLEEEKWLLALAIFEVTFYGNMPVA